MRDLSFFCRDLPIEGGVHVCADSDYYWGVIPRDEMRAFISEAKVSGFVRATAGFPFSGRFDYATNDHRADFMYFLPLSSDSVVLDLASGFGNITIPLAKQVRTVVAVDASRELLECVKVRADEIGQKNIEYVLTGPFEDAEFPFKEKSFDVIILNGILEWIGSASSGSSPQLLQERLLKRLRPLLKDGGVLFVGIENRWHPGWIRRDPHSKLPWTSILPRPFATWYSRWKLGQPYRTYIYSLPAYQHMFRSCGFNTAQVYFPIPSYRRPVLILPDAKTIAQRIIFGVGRRYFSSWWLFALRILIPLNLHRYFLSSFFFVVPTSASDVPVRAAQIMRGVVQFETFAKTGERGGDAHFSVFSGGIETRLAISEDGTKVSRV